MGHPGHLPTEERRREIEEVVSRAGFRLVSQQQLSMGTTAARIPTVLGVVRGLFFLDFSPVRRLLDDTLEFVTGACHVDDNCKAFQRDRHKSAAVQRALEVQRQHHRQFEHVDACLIWPRSEGDEQETVLRPVTRLVTCLSHGLPTLVYPYASYEELIRGAELGYNATAKTVGELQQRLAELKAIGAWRPELVDKRVRFAQHYNHESIAQMYIDLMMSL
eukprot:scaffold260_cov274-Pinguiococcus_pyrenoidosus.AAC.14